MPSECQRLVNSYLQWLRERITVEEVNGACEITTPFLDRHNDRLQIYVVRQDGGYRLTDDGYILSDLEVSGCSLESPNRQRMLHVILSGFGVHEDEGALFVDASIATFPQKKHSLVQAMLAVNDMFMIARPHVTQLFLEEVAGFLDAKDVRFTPSVEFTGKTGFVHKFDFAIPASKKSPERLVKAINHPSKDSVTAALFAWTDTREVRSRGSRFYAILNDRERPPSTEISAAMREYDVTPIVWSAREQYAIELAA
ncbi:MAG: DUF1829 domain-containing protein [Planctomycetaceae bacterium]|nr:DUF1829 domain-containing protein [Planctomycetaceae bacterium]